MRLWTVASRNLNLYPCLKAFISSSLKSEVLFLPEDRNTTIMESKVLTPSPFKDPYRLLMNSCSY